ncbi:glycosyltransferase family 17 protein [Leptothrix discophora]|uniref:Beta-1,4-mannosyl-glycoprotein beta-1,4-N-acetylglucosaminyltransferase n=1 Tax=Leptothrix discophora TaxID=89 RepID=A0ABT9G6W7_LEPDI|nr:hypothetical protein [Leptothrix discophora]MDP4301997.1 hypothetical protein [Leptothrix discophora]
MKIFDCFTDNDERALLKLRLETLDAHVDPFVIAQATRTFTGKPKPLRFNINDVPEYRHKIHHIKIDNLSEDPADAWKIEHAQREALQRGFAQAASHDWIILSDGDEIPNPHVIRHDNREKYGSAVLEQRISWYTLNNALVSENPDLNIRITTVDHFRRHFKELRIPRSQKFAGPFRARHRLLSRKHTQHLKPGGWHFSYLMTIEEIRSFSHQEYNKPEFVDSAHIKSCIERGVDIFKTGARFNRIEIDESFPEPICKRPEKFRSLIF